MYFSNILQEIIVTSLEIKILDPLILKYSWLHHGLLALPRCPIAGFTLSSFGSASDCHGGWMRILWLSSHFKFFNYQRTSLHQKSVFVQLKLDFALKPEYSRLENRTTWSVTAMPGCAKAVLTIILA